MYISMCITLSDKTFPTGGEYFNCYEQNFSPQDHPTNTSLHQVTQLYAHRCEMRCTIAIGPSRYNL